MDVNPARSHKSGRHGWDEEPDLLVIRVSEELLVVRDTRLTVVDLIVGTQSRPCYLKSSGDLESAECIYPLKV